VITRAVAAWLGHADPGLRQRTYVNPVGHAEFMDDLSPGTARGRITAECR